MLIPYMSLQKMVYWISKNKWCRGSYGEQHIIEGFWYYFSEVEAG